MLRFVADVARGIIRSSDSLARYGGEEFVIIAPETDEDAAVQLAERIRLELRSREIQANGGIVCVTASFGVTAVHPEIRDAEQALRQGDLALYAAKAAGRDRVARAAARTLVER